MVRLLDCDGFFCFVYFSLFLRMSAFFSSDCEYGDHWKDYCFENVRPPNVDTVCNKYGEMCCGKCSMYESLGHAGKSWYIRVIKAMQAL